jgi:hypothetical protein
MYFYRPDNMKIYIPIDVFNRDDIKALYTSLGPKIVKDISSQIDRYYDLCQTIDISKEFKHNKYIQQKYFNCKLDKGSAPLYISKSNRVHISKLHNGSKQLKLLEIYTNSATTPEQITAAYRIITVSFWADFTAHNILPWVDKHYEILYKAGMKISRIPFISNINRYNFLLSLGKVIANTGNAYIYCIWQGNRRKVQQDLTTVKLRVNQECCLFDSPEGKNIEECVKNIDKQLSMIESRLNDQKPSASSLCDNEQETVPISENSLTVSVNTQSIYTPEYIIAKLGRKGAAELAQAILNKLLE